MNRLGPLLYHPSVFVSSGSIESWWQLIRVGFMSLWGGSAWFHCRLGWFVWWVWRRNCLESIVLCSFTGRSFVSRWSSSMCVILVHPVMTRKDEFWAACCLLQWVSRSAGVHIVDNRPWDGLVGRCQEFLVFSPARTSKSLQHEVPLPYFVESVVGVGIECVKAVQGDSQYLRVLRGRYCMLSDFNIVHNTFNAYMSGLPTPPDGIKLTSYADDCTSYASGPTIPPICEKLNSYLTTLHEWLEELDLELSPGKSTATVCTTFSQEVSMSLPIKIGQHTVPTTKCTGYSALWTWSEFELWWLESSLGMRFN